MSGNPANPAALGQLKQTTYPPCLLYQPKTPLEMEINVDLDEDVDVDIDAGVVIILFYIIVAYVADSIPSVGSYGAGLAWLVMSGGPYLTHTSFHPHIYIITTRVPVNTIHLSNFSKQIVPHSLSIT